MKLKILITILFSFIAAISQAQNNWLTKKQIAEDIEFLTQTLDEKSSYVYLNGYEFENDFENYLNTLEDSTRLEDFGLFIIKTLAKLGDRHFFLTKKGGFDLNGSLFLPFFYAPENDKVVVLDFDQNGEFEILNPKFPYLKEIDEININDFLQKILPEDIKAPKETYFTLAVSVIQDIQINYMFLGKALPKEIKLTLSDTTFQNDTLFVVPTIDKSKRLHVWEEKFKRQYGGVKPEDFNKHEIIEKLFSVKDDIAYFRLPVMAGKDEAPLLYDKLNLFMPSILNNSKAMIIDVRSNGGGTRHLIYELAKYLVHPDSVYVINATRQRGPDPLPKDYKERLKGRFLFSFSELDSREQKKVTEFLKTFKPMYELDDKKYSEYYFGLLNGKKLAESSFYYNKPVYILANENTFSAASVFVSAFKGIHNIKIVGVTTDGSSGNSEWFDLPNSKLFVKISTMVSFQKNGKILDGYGTDPDIRIERDINQIQWKSDTQLEKLKSLILTEN